MNTPLTHRLAAAVASMAITFMLFSSVVGIAGQPLPAALLAQADAARVH